MNYPRDPVDWNRQSGDICKDLQTNRSQGGLSATDGGVAQR